MSRSRRAYKFADRFSMFAKVVGLVVLLGELLAATSVFAVTIDPAAKAALAAEQAAFECSDLARWFNNPEETARLIAYGLEQGRIEGNFEVKTADQTSPLASVSADFWIGAAWDGASRTIDRFMLTNIPTPAPGATGDSLTAQRRGIASDEYNRRNCKTVGAAAH
jgi:hypothetical protein